MGANAKGIEALKRYAASRKLPTPEPRACLSCKGSFTPRAKYPQQRYCSLKCAAAGKAPDHNARVARESAQHRGNLLRGRGEGKTYRKLNGRHEHRVLAEQKLGRPLATGEIVHHADEDRRNNAPDNLEALASQAEHARLHFKGKKQSPEHVRKRVESRKRTMESKSK